MALPDIQDLISPTTTQGEAKSWFTDLITSLQNDFVVRTGWQMMYERDEAWSLAGRNNAGDRITLLSPHSAIIGVHNTGYILAGQKAIDLSVEENWDTISGVDYTAAANRIGMDFYIYAVEPDDGVEVDILLSANSTYPNGYTADDSRKIGGFHCLCANVGPIVGHPLSNFIAGDILPESIWDLAHRPRCSPEGMVYSPEANIWVDIYLQSGTGLGTTSVYGGSVTASRDWMDFTDDLGAVKKRMLNDPEFQLIAEGSNQKTNIAGSADPGTTGGHVDTAGRRMISNIGCEDCCGAYYQWLSDQSYRFVTTTTTYNWYTLPGNKGSLYNQSSTGYADVKLRAGGHWPDGADCGSRCRAASSFRWSSSSIIGCRGAVEPL